MGEIDAYRLHFANIEDEAWKSALVKVFSGYRSLKEVLMPIAHHVLGFAVFKDKKSADGVEVAESRIRVME